MQPAVSWTQHGKIKVYVYNVLHTFNMESIVWYNILFSKLRVYIYCIISADVQIFVRWSRHEVCESLHPELWIPERKK